jgi:hypothetical protein
MIIGKAISPFALRKINGGGGNDPDAQLFITATGISGTNATATNQLVIDLKAANIWTKMKAVYPFVGNTSASQKYNLKDARDLDVAYRLAFFGGGTHSANGYQCNGTNSYANTFINWLNDTLSNDIHISAYSRTNNTATSRADIGASTTSAPDNYLMQQMITTTSIISINNGGVFTNITGTSSLGFGLSTRTVNNVRYYNNNVLKSNITVANIGTRISKSIYIGALNSNTLMYSNKQYAFISLGTGLTDAEALAFYNAVQTFNTTLGRQV